jgi:hypothetical protein
MAALHAVYYRDVDRRDRVRDFLDGLDDDVQAVLSLQIDQLEFDSDDQPTPDLVRL